jgi:hypothetical protein
MTSRQAMMAKYDVNDGKIDNNSAEHVLNRTYVEPRPLNQFNNIGNQAQLRSLVEDDEASEHDENPEEQLVTIINNFMRNDQEFHKFPS